MEYFNVYKGPFFSAGKPPKLNNPQISALLGLTNPEMLQRAGVLFVLGASLRGWSLWVEV